MNEQNEILAEQNRNIERLLERWESDFMGNNQNWIPISEKIPEEYEDVLVQFKYYDETVIDIGWIDNGEFILRRRKGGYFPMKIKVTHWMQLPEPRKD